MVAFRPLGILLIAFILAAQQPSATVRGVVTDSSGAVVPGAFDTNPLPGQTIVPRNYLTGAGMWNLNMRVGRTFLLGKPKDRRYSLNVNVDVNNLFNHVNPGGYVGNLSSPLFGQPTNLFLFRDPSNNRRVQLGAQFSF